MLKPIQCSLVVLQLSCFGVVPSLADDSVPPLGEATPILRLEANGPRSYVSGLAFSPDGMTLYATGWDKAVQVWNSQNGVEYRYSSGATLRVPTGAGVYGKLNALAVSTDGEWLATAGQGPQRGISNERQSGWIVPVGHLSEAGKLDNGTIFVFNTTRKTTIQLKGHQGPVQALTFVQNGNSNRPQLVSIATEYTVGNATQVKARVWDIQAEEEIASLSSVPSLDGNSWVPLPKLNGFRPGLAAWSTGANPRQVRVALALGDDQFRIWDVEPPGVANSRSVSNVPGRWQNNIVAVLPITPKGDLLVTGANAQIGVWSVPKAADGGLGRLGETNFQPSGFKSLEAGHLASAVTLIRSANGRPAYLAFVVTHYLDNGEAEYRLLIATTQQPIKLLREIPLPDWRGSVRTPVIAASNDGQRIALAGNPKKEIEVHRVENLIDGKLLPKTLRGVGFNVDDGKFVRSGDDWGLQFVTTNRDEAGRASKATFVFDTSQRQVESGSDKWKSAVSKPEGWSAVPSTGSLSVRRSDNSSLNIQLFDDPAMKDHVLTAYAICPPSAHCPIPLVAIASQERGEPILQIFNGENGTPLRRCVGHTERIRSASFSDDGRMLMTCANDQTICVWTMTDLVERNLGKRGLIAGVQVDKEFQRLIVADDFLNKGLQKKDEIVSIEVISAVNKGAQKTVKSAADISSALDFYKFMRDQRPGDVAELKIQRDGKLLTVRRDIGQAIDETKPLFTLFLVPNTEKPGSWEWIGWHPLGKFDSRGDHIDERLGWHFNTWEKNRPAKFAPLDQYREEYYRRNLLQLLIETQKLPQEVVIPEEPNVSVLMRQRGTTVVPAGYDDVPLLKSPDCEIVAEVSGIADLKSHGVSVSVDEMDPIELKRQTDSSEWLGDLSKVKWQRGRHRLTVRLKTPNREFTSVERVDYFPAAPTIEWKPDPVWGKAFPGEKVVINATIIPSSEPMHVRLVRRRPKQEKPEELRSWDSQERLTISESVDVDAGENLIELEAWNSTVPDSQRQLEQVRFTTFVHRETPPMAPRIIVKRVTVLPTGQNQRELSAKGDTYFSQWKKIRIQGEVEGEALLSTATLTIGGQKTRDLTGFKTGNARNFTIDETLSLEPGKQAVTFSSAIGNESNEKHFSVFFEPSVPRIMGCSVNAVKLREFPQSVVQKPQVFVDGYHEKNITFVAELDTSLESDYRTQVLVNEIPIAPNSVTIDKTLPRKHLVKAQIPLNFGKNQVTLRVDNEWTRHPSEKSLQVEFLRPPVIGEVDAPAEVVEKPLDLKCRIRSAANLALRTAKISVDNDESYPVSSSYGLIDGSPDIYLLDATIPLAEGEHILKITASNDDGAAIEPKFHTVICKKNVSKPPTLTIEGNPEETHNSKQFEIKYAVHSTEPTHLVIRRQGVDTPRINNVPTDGSVQTAPIELEYGLNNIEVTAYNSSGPSEKQTKTISLPRPPAIVVIEKINDQNPKLNPDGSAEFVKSFAESHVDLHGHVELNEKITGARNLKARILVNRFALPPIDIVADSENPYWGRFKTELNFSQKQNRIEIQIYDTRNNKPLASNSGDTKLITVKCDKPERKQHLYLVLFGGVEDQNQLHEQARLALGATGEISNDSRQEWNSNAFPRITVINALDRSPTEVKAKVLMLKKTMLSETQRATNAKSQPLLMFFFQGDVNITEEDVDLATIKEPESLHLPLKTLAQMIEDSIGMQLLFLSLNQNEKNLVESDIWPKAPHLGIIVANWKGGGQVPEKARLMSALDQALPQSRIVGDLSSNIDRYYEPVRRLHPSRIETIDRLTELQTSPFGVLE